MLVAMGFTPFVRARAEAGATSVVAVAAAVATHAGLRAALRRAAAGRDWEHLAADLDALRTDPVRKRALWPALRALRKAP